MAVVYGLVEVEALLHGCSHEPLLENLLVGVVRQLTKKRFSVHGEQVKKDLQKRGLCNRCYGPKEVRERGIKV